MKTLLLAGLLLAGTQLVRASEVDCKQLAQAGLFEHTTVTAANFFAADAAKSLPANCDITAVISAVPGSKVTVVYRLPKNWNGKMLAFGGGGWAGNTALGTAAPGLAKGYATAQTNGGHDSKSSFDTTWAEGNPVAMTDFSYRAVHQMTVTGKSVVGRYYGKAATRNYFHGCSTGGRMGLMEAQRFPDDYDGIVAGAPVYSLLVQTSPAIRNRLFTAPGAAVSAAQMQRVNEAALAACDASDGLKDGVVTDPRRCGWDPGGLQCKAGESGDSCLTPTQVGALRQVYTTIKDANGVVGNYALTRGGEAGWLPFVQATPTGTNNAATGILGELLPYIFGDAKYDIAKFEPLKDQAAVHKTPFAKEYEASNPQLTAFLKRGGKLLMWHGFDDPGPSPYATIDYYELAKTVNGKDSAVQLFIAPGVYHCGGGPGADKFDLIDAIDRWVEKKQAPQVIAATNSKTGAERPLCAYPALPYYTGSGDPNKASSFACRTRAP